jgi:hypothetical protein
LLNYKKDNMKIFGKQIDFRFKIIVLFFGFLLCIQSVYSQSNGLNFQGVARNASGVILASQKIGLKLSIINGSETGNVEYVETRLVNTNPQGIFSIVIGDTAVLTTLGNFTNINWKTNAKFLKVEMDPIGGTTYVNMGITQLQKVPYAYYANGVNAANIDGILPLTAGGTGVTSIPSFKSALNLDQVNNTSDLAKPISTSTQAALDVKANNADLANKAPIASPTFTGTVSGITKAMVGLGSVDNTSDLSKPLSTATINALAGKASTTDVTNSLLLKENIANKSASVNLGTSDDLYPTQKAVKAYVDAQISAGGVADNGITSIKIADGTIVNADVNSSAAIGYSKLNLTGSIVNSDVNASAGIGYSKLNLTGAIVGSDISNSAAIPFSKLNISKADINGLGIPSNSDLTSYTAGNGLQLTGNTFSVASNVVTSTYGGSLTVNGNLNIDANSLFANAISHNVGIGTNTPVSKLEVNGASTNSSAYNATNGTTIDFSLSNLAYTSASAGSFTLNNIKDGGTYTLAVQGTTSGTSSFSSTGFTFYSTNNGATTSNKQTLYTFIVMGANVYYFMTTGF